MVLSLYNELWGFYLMAGRQALSEVNFGGELKSTPTVGSSFYQQKIEPSLVFFGRNRKKSYLLSFRGFSLNYIIIYHPLIVLKLRIKKMFVTKKIKLKKERCNLILFLLEFGKLRLLS